MDSARDPLPARRPGDRRALTAIDGANALVAVLVVVQMWLLSAAVESALAGHDDGTLPAAIASGLLAVGCFLLFRYTARLDRGSRRARRHL